MEDVLDLYAEPFQPWRPTICFDERPYQLLADVCEPLPAESGRARRQDYEYERHGTCNLFVMCQPLAGWRHVKATEHRRKNDFAECMRELVDVHFPYAEVVRIVLDNLNIHTPAALYESFPPQEARRILKKLEFHYTPKHGSWLNMAEIELSILSRQCLGQRIANQDHLANELQAWTVRRNHEQAKIAWCFSVEQARTRLSHLYPDLTIMVKRNK